MRSNFLRYLFLVVLAAGAGNSAFAQKKKKTTTVRKRTSTKRTTKNKTTADVSASTASQDSAALTAGAAPVNDSLPIRKVLPSLRRDAAVDDDQIRDRIPLAYENLRADDAVYRHKVWREIDAREKINLPFRYAADENNGNQRFISILLQAVQDSAVTVFSNIDDRFTTPMTKAEVSTILGGDVVEFQVYDSNGVAHTEKKRNEVNLDSIYKFHIKEEVIFDKESSRLFFRILGIAPVKNVITSQGIDLGPTELFWVYYPDMRETFAKHDVYNGKNYGARMSWEDLFESRMFYGRIVKSTLDNPYDLYIKNYKGLSENGILQLLEGENVKDKIFNYEQDLWSY